MNASFTSSTFDASKAFILGMALIAAAIVLISVIVAIPIIVIMLIDNFNPPQHRLLEKLLMSTFLILGWRECMEDVWVSCDGESYSYHMSRLRLTDGNAQLGDVWERRMQWGHEHPNSASGLESLHKSELLPAADCGWYSTAPEAVHAFLACVPIRFLWGTMIRIKH